MEHKLKPCPFCGHTPTPSQFSTPKPDREWCAIYHFCDDSTSELTVSLTVYGKTRDDVIARWNKRYTKLKRFHVKHIKRFFKWLHNLHPIRNAVDEGIIDHSGQGRNKYGK